MPTDSPDPAPFLLTGYGIPYSVGFLSAPDGSPNPSPLEPATFLDTAVEMGLAGVEMPLKSYRGNVISLPLEQLKAELEARHLTIVPDFMVLSDADLSEIRAFLEAAAALGATVTRALLSPLLCGDRRRLTDGWSAHLAVVAARLNEVLPIARDLGLCIAMENHQDATSGDLLQLAERVNYSPAYGVCLDTGNPLAVGEGPVEFARRVAPLIRHIHLKDYTIHFAPEGYRLVRCPAGEGVVDFAAILELARENGHPLLPGIEVAAQQTRTIPLLEASWWECYPPEQPIYLTEALRVLWKHGRPPEEAYGSAWERGLDHEQIVAEEWSVLRRSVEYFTGAPTRP